jgi:CubicO group peptidase (beta-lactamase class C family)
MLRTRFLFNKINQIPIFWKNEYCQLLKPQTPKLKYIEYKNHNLYTMNNMDNEVLDQNSEFMIGSVTKLFTIVTILRMQQDNLLDVNDKLSKYIPNDNNNDFSNVTIFDVMNHTSGIKKIGDKFYKVKPKKFENATDASTFFMDENLFTLQKGINSYSIIGYVLLGKIMEEITKKTYLDLYSQYIFKQFGLNNTMTGKNNIQLYQNNKKLNEYQILERYFATTTGGLYSTVSDLLKFSVVLQNLNNDSISILKNMYVFKENDKNFFLETSGDISGGKSSVIYTYNKNNFDVLDVEIKMKTN